MIYSKLRELKFAREEREGRKLTYEALTQETGLAPGTLARLFSREPLDRIDAKTLSTLCAYFSCEVCDVLAYKPDEGEGAAV